MRTIIGLAGEIGSGKGTIIQFLESQRKIVVVSAFPVLKEVLSVIGVEVSRKNLQDVASMLCTTFGPEVLPKVLLQNSGSFPSNVIVYDGLRYCKQAEYLRSVPDARVVILAVHADEKTRFDRVGQRNQYRDEEQLSWKEFQDMSIHPVEREVQRIMKHADRWIDNSGTKEDLYAQLTTFLSELP